MRITVSSRYFLLVWLTLRTCTAFMLGYYQLQTEMISNLAPEKHGYICIVNSCNPQLAGFSCHHLEWSSSQHSDRHKKCSITYVCNTATDYWITGRTTMYMWFIVKTHICCWYLMKTSNRKLESYITYRPCLHVNDTELLTHCWHICMDHMN